MSRNEGRGELHCNPLKGALRREGDRLDPLDHGKSMSNNFCEEALIFGMY